MRPSVALLLCGLLAGARPAQAPASTVRGERARPEPASFLVILVDDWGRADLETARTDQDPWNDLHTIDALAAAGQSWRHFYAQPICVPTRRTLMHGTYLGGTGGITCTSADPDGAPPQGPTLASHLKGLGYTTAAFGKWHIGPRPEAQGGWAESPRAFGFDHWRAWHPSNLFRHCGSRGYGDWQRVDDGVARPTTEYHTQAVARAARSWWQEVSGPKFAYVCFQAPHPPLHAPPPALLPADYPEPETPRAMFDAMLVAMDRAIAEILEVVDAEHTYVLVLGDNGTPPNAARPEQRPRTGVKPALRVKATTFEGGINVPLIVRGPSVQRGETRALGHVVDLLATLGDLAGGPLPEGIRPDSVSLAPVFRDASLRVRDHVICERISVRFPSRQGHLESEQRSTRDLAILLQTQEPEGLLKARWHGKAIRARNARTLFDLVQDPEELAPIREPGPAYAGRVERLEALWSAYRAR